MPYDERQGFLDPKSNLALMFVTGVSVLMSFQGLKLVLVASEATWLNHVTAAAVAAATGVMIYALWAIAYRSISTARRGLAVVLVMCITLGFIPGVVGVSSIFNVTGFAGNDAVGHHLNTELVQQEAALDARYGSARGMDRFLPPIALAAKDYAIDAAAECGTGGRTGAGGDGTVCRTLTAIAGRLSRLANESLPALQLQATTLADAARVILEDMRNVASGPKPMDQKQDQLARLANQFRSKLSELEALDLATTIRVTLQSLPGETSKRALSGKSESSRARQRVTLDTLNEELTDLARQFDADLAAAALADLPSVPSLDQISPVKAVLIYWDHYIPYWIMGISLDLMPLFFLLYQCAYKSVRSEHDIFVERALQRTIGDYLIDKTGEDILRGQGTDATEVRKALGYATGKRDSMAEKEQSDE